MKIYTTIVALPLFQVYLWNCFILPKELSRNLSGDKFRVVFHLRILYFALITIEYFVGHKLKVDRFYLSALKQMLFFHLLTSLKKMQ